MGNLSGTIDLAENPSQRLTYDRGTLEIVTPLPEHEINIPSNLKYCTAGDRIITSDNNGNIIGLEIKDIYWDCVTIPNKIIKEITIDKLTSSF